MTNQGWLSVNEREGDGVGINRQSLLRNSKVFCRRSLMLYVTNIAIGYGLFKRFLQIKKNFMTPFWMGFNRVKVTAPPQGDSLLFTTKSPGVPGTHLIDLGRIKGSVDLGATKWF